MVSVVAYRTDKHRVISCIIFRASGKGTFNAYLSVMISCSLYLEHSLEEAGWFSLQLAHFAVGWLFSQLYFVGIPGTSGCARGTLHL